MLGRNDIYADFSDCVLKKIEQLQYVKIFGTRSNGVHITWGVLYGSHLEPPLFNLFINDIVDYFSYSKCLMLNH